MLDGPAAGGTLAVALAGQAFVEFEGYPGEVPFGRRPIVVSETRPLGFLTSRSPIQLPSSADSFRLRLIVRPDFAVAHSKPRVTRYWNATYRSNWLDVNLADPGAETLWFSSPDPEAKEAGQSVKRSASRRGGSDGAAVADGRAEPIAGPKGAPTGPNIIIETTVLEITRAGLGLLGLESVPDSPLQKPTLLRLRSSSTTSTAGDGAAAGIDQPDGAADAAGLYDRIKALERAGEARVIARPQILARNNQSAKMNIGKAIPLIAAQDAPDNNDRSVVDAGFAGVVLNVRPRITADGAHIQMHVVVKYAVRSPEQEPAATKGTVRSAVITARELSTQVLLANEGVIVIGGMGGGKTSPDEPNAQKATREVVFVITARIVVQDAELERE